MEVNFDHEQKELDKAVGISSEIIDEAFEILKDSTKESCVSKSIEKLINFADDDDKMVAVITVLYKVMDPRFMISNRGDVECDCPGCRAEREGKPRPEGSLTPAQLMELLGAGSDYDPNTEVRSIAGAMRLERGYKCHKCDGSASLFQFEDEIWCEGCLKERPDADKLKERLDEVCELRSYGERNARAREINSPIPVFSLVLEGELERKFGDDNE